MALPGFAHPGTDAGYQTAGPRFKRLTTAEGLSENSVYCLLLDHQGFLWAGTQDGLNRYDGAGFRIFRADARAAGTLHSGFILALAEDRRHRVWVGTGGGGLSRYDPATETFRTFRAPRTGAGQAVSSQQPGPLPNDFVRAVLVDRTGRLWVGTEVGLSCYDPRADGFRTYRHLPGGDPRLNSVRAIAQTSDGKIWVGTAAGRLDWFDERRGVLEPTWHPPADETGAAPDIGQHAITTLLADRAGRLWIGTEGDGLRAWEPATGRARTFRPSAANPATTLPSLSIRGLLRDRAGNLWIATAAGLSCLDPATERCRTFHHNSGFPTSSLPDEGTQALCQDRTGMLWVATEGGLGTFSDQPGAFTRVGPAEASIWAVAPNPRRPGHLWVGTEDTGVLALSDENVAAAPLAAVPRLGPGGLPQPFVRALCPDRAGFLWVGTQSSGLVRFDPATDRTRAYRHDARQPASLLDDYVRAITQDQAGYLWIGTEGGLSRYDPRTDAFTGWQHDPADPASLPSNYVRQAFEDRRGRLWVATGGGGLALMDTARSGRFRAFRHAPADPHSLPADFVRVLHEDRAGTLWVGTEGGGLARLDGLSRGKARFTTFDTRNGLPSNVVYAILEDAGGFLWLATNRGVARFDPRRRVFRRYDMRDGLLRDEFNAGAFGQGAGGRLYFGGPAGLLAFHPDSLQVNRITPPVVLTGLRIFNQPARLDTAIGYRRVLKLRPEENFLTFEFAALSFRLPDKNHYAYQLVGLDPGWIDAGNRREAPYTNLDPGEYTFRVRAANNDGLWNLVGASVRILIPPPWYRTWWFRALLSALLFALLWTAYQMRVAQLLALERVRHGIARDLHDDMGSTLSSISILSQVARQHHQSGRAEQVAALLTQIGESSHRMLDSMDDIVWAINPAHDVLEDVVTRMRTFAVDVLEARGIDFTFRVSDEVLALRLEMRARREFFLLFKEAVNNLAKYARCQEASITLSYEHRHLVLRVIDDGVGFDLSAPAQGGGNGMTNMRQRAAALRATLTVDTAPGKGTRLTLAVPM